MICRYEPMRTYWGRRQVELEMETPPNSGGVSTFGQLRSTCQLARLLLRHLRLHSRDRSADLDRARLGCLGHFVNHIDRKHAVVEAGTHHLQVVSETKAPLETAPGDATVQVADAVLVLLLCALARHQKRVLLNGDVELCRREPGHGHREPARVFAGLLDVVRRVGERCAIN